MKCAVVVVLCGLTATSATFGKRNNRQHSDTGNYYQEDYGYYGSTASPVTYNDAYRNVEQPNVLDLNNNLQYDAPKYTNVQYAPVQHGVSNYYPNADVSAQYGAPLSPYPVQYNQYQLGQTATPQYDYNDVFGPAYAPGVMPVKTTAKPTTTAPPPPPPPQPPNNILSLLLSLSQASSSFSLPRSTRPPPKAVVTTVATAQPPPKAQIYSIVNPPPSPYQLQQPYQNPPLYDYPPQRRIFSHFFG